MQTTLKRRVERLEERSGVQSGRPRKTERIVYRNLGRNPCLENAMCIRTLSPDGTLFEMVDLGREGPEIEEDLSDEALDRFVESFPIRII
jgi:hypothetical protein